MLRPAVDPSDPLDLHVDAELLPALAPNRLPGPLARVDGASGKLPSTLDVANEENPSSVLPDQGMRRRHEEEIGSDLRTKRAHVVGHPHGVHGSRTGLSFGA